METSEETMDVINDLIVINNDRIAGFEKAQEDLGDQGSGYANVFNKLADDSRQNVAELNDIALQYGGEVTEGTSTSGALHRAWIDLKATFTGHDLEGVLKECERGEDAIKAAYDTALNADNDLSPEVAEILQKQWLKIIEGHNQIKALRDEVAASNDDSEVIDNDDELYDAEDTEEIEPAYVDVANTYDQQQGSVYVPEPETLEQEEAWEETQTGTGNSKLMEFFVEELKDLLWAERELVDTLPDMADAATSGELKTAFQNHLAETQIHVDRLEQIFGILGLEPDTTKCDAMAGIVDEGDNIISNTDEGTAQRDVGLIFAGQKAEHYEIASYGGMVSLAKTLGYYEIAEILVLTLDEEKSADALLTEIAENHVNYDASKEPQED